MRRTAMLVTTVEFTVRNVSFDSGMRADGLMSNRCMLLSVVTTPFVSVR